MLLTAWKPFASAAAARSFSMTDRASMSAVITTIKIFLKDLPFIAGTLPDFYVAKHPYAQVINEAIIQLPDSVRNSAVVYTSGLKHKGDTTHFNTASVRLLGERYAAVFQTLFKKR